MGGMQALQWAVAYPDAVRSVDRARHDAPHSPQQIAFNEVARQAIMADPAWNGGDYYDGEGRRGRAWPWRGWSATSRTCPTWAWSGSSAGACATARSTATTSHRLRGGKLPAAPGRGFVERFDANSLLYMTKALDYFDLPGEAARCAEAFARQRGAMFLLMAFSSDWLYPPHQLEGRRRCGGGGGGDPTYCEIASDYGHDAFLLEHEAQEPLLRAFLGDGSSAAPHGAEVIPSARTR